MKQITNLIISRMREQIVPLSMKSAGSVEIAGQKASPKTLQKAGESRAFYEEGTKTLTSLVTGLSQLLDRIAGLCMVAVMVLVVANILLRALLKHPILGTYEYVGFLAAAVIGLALACCAVQNGHIAVSFVVDRFPASMQAVVDIIVNTVALCFWGLAAWYLGKYAHSLSVNGVVSSTTQTPFYFFIYLVSFGLLVLCLVLLVKLIESIRRVIVNR